MKISELNVRDFLSRNTNAETNSYLILNYGENDTDPSVTYRISLEELSNMIISNHKLLKYASENKNLTSRKYASNAYSDTAAVGQYIDTTDRTVLDSAVTAVSYDGTNKKLTSSVRGGTATDIVTVETLKTDMELNNVNNTSDANKPVSTAQQTALDLKMNNTARGAINGVASLDENGKIPVAQLPSYVDDIIEGYYYQGAFYNEVNHTTAISGESGKIYVDLTEGGARQVYRWGGTSYTAIPIGLALGETASTAYAGDKGAAAYAHAVTNKGIAKANDLYKITTNSEGHVTAATAVTSTDITDLFGKAIVLTDDSRLSDARNAADVSAWAKAATKPTYTATEVGVPAWAQAAEPPTTFNTITIGSTTLNETQLQSLLALLEQ